jgi:ABC-type antimicrobial peptide transport system permease subunit
LLTESVLLSLGGGALGVLFAFWSLHWIQILGPKSVPRIHDIGIDGAALLFTFLISLGSGALFGLAPALRISRLNVNATLQDASRRLLTAEKKNRG